MIGTSDPSTSSEGRWFRPRRYYFVVGVFSVVLFAVFGILFTAAAYWNIDGSFERPERDALLFGTFFGGFTLLGLWIILAYLRERLCLGANRIVQYGVIRARTIEIDAVNQITWLTRPLGGAIVVRSHRGKARIYLANFTKAERAEVIRFFRETFADKIQQDRKQFEENSCRPLQQKKPVPTPSHVLISSGLVLLAATWPVLTLQLGKPASWLGEFVFLGCLMLSILGAPTLCLLTLMDVMKRRADGQVLSAFVLSFGAVIVICYFLYLHMYRYAPTI